MSIFDIFSSAERIASEAIENPDLRNELLTKLNEAKEETYRAALNATTVPWVDALHKMSRPIISVVVAVAPVALLAVQPDIPIEKLLIAVGGGSVPASIYTKIKGKGR